MNRLSVARSGCLGLLAAGLVLASPLSARADDYPSRPIKLLVGASPGGTTDTMARAIAPPLASSLRRPIVVENRPGAGGNLAADAVAKSAPDGYTILLTTNGHAISPALYHKLPFDPVKDFIPVTQLVASSLLLVATPRLAATSTQELIALARSRPGQLNYGSTG